MKMIKLLSALPLIASVSSVALGQTPAPSAAPPPPAVKHEPGPTPEPRRMEVRKMVMAHAAMAAPVAMRPGMHGRMMDAASMLLAHTGELQLTDAQVTKLAAIARRSEAREKAMSTRMDSLKMREHSDGMADGRGGDMRVVRMRVVEMSDADRKAQHEDNREAFAIPTPDQLATAWELMAMHHRR
jgi:hypothetical protein